MGVRRWVVAAGVGAATVIGSLSWSDPASADIYQWRDRFGTLHFTNVPTNARYKVVIRDSGARVRPTARRTRSRAVRSDPTRFDPIISSMARRYRIDQTLVKAVIRAESSYQPNAVSPAGARGLMQLMPATAARHGVRNIHSPVENIRGGVEHLRTLLDRYQDNVVLALAAYNAGPGAVDRYRGVPPYRETREYVRRVLRFRQEYLQQRLAHRR